MTTELILLGWTLVLALVQIGLAGAMRTVAGRSCLITGCMVSRRNVMPAEAARPPRLSRLNTPPSFFALSTAMAI